MESAKRALLLLALVCSLAGAAAAQEARPTPSDPVPAEVGYPVKLDGEEVFRLYGSRSGAFSLEQSVQMAQARVLAIAQDPFYANDLITTEREEDGVWIRYRGKPVGFVADDTAQQLGMSAERRAAEVVAAVREAITRYRARREPAEWMRSGLLLAGATLALALALRLLFVAHRRVAARVGARELGRVPRWASRMGFRQTARVAAFQLRLLRLARAVVAALLVIVYLQAAFAIVPLTRGYALSVIGYLVDPLRIVWHSLLANVGGLFFVLVMVIVARLVLRGLRSLFGEAAAGTLHLPGVEREYALPLYKIVRLVVIAITGVMIYPYIPGSHSAAFQGISLFAGALFTLGASSTASNFIGGMLLVFSSAFRVGDRVQIGDVTGDVVESTLALTRICTPKNELVTFANSVVLSQRFVNYSAMARRQGVIVHTQVTIGYDVPWRQVHELLTQAALHTRDIVAEPKPFVLQTALNDFHVGYEINAYTRTANAMARIRGELHQNIQDAFRDAGVEILSPAYSALRDGGASTVPAAEAVAEETERDAAS